MGKEAPPRWGSVSGSARCRDVQERSGARSQDGWPWWGQVVWAADGGGGLPGPGRGGRGGVRGLQSGAWRPSSVACALRAWQGCTPCLGLHHWLPHRVSWVPGLQSHAFTYLGHLPAHPGRPRGWCWKERASATGQAEGAVHVGSAEPAQKWVCFLGAVPCAELGFAVRSFTPVPSGPVPGCLPAWLLPLPGLAVGMQPSRASRCAPRESVVVWGLASCLLPSIYEAE